MVDSTSSGGAVASPVTSTKPYLIRAIHEWCCDNGFTPYVAVVVNEQTDVPREHIKDGEIVLNVSPMATAKLKFGNEWLEFSARFGGVAREIWVPIGQIAAIYAKETGHGMGFEIETLKSEHRPEATVTTEATPAKPSLAVASAQVAEAGEPPAITTKRPKLTVVK